MRRAAGVFLVVGAGALAAVAWAGGAGEPSATARATSQLTPLQQRLMSGFASRALDRASSGASIRGAMRPLPSAGVGETSETGCPADRGSNVRVNQNCQNLTD